MMLFSDTSRHPVMVKNKAVGVFTKILHLAPAKLSGYEVCPARSKGCTEACLNTAGFHRTGRGDKQAARIRRTKFYFEDREAFMDQLAREISNAQKLAKKKGLIPGIRLNGTSDIPWESVRYKEHRNIMEAFPDIAFMDYTKRHNRKNLPKNYRLTFSRAEDNGNHCLAALRNGMNVCVVFAKELPEIWSGMRVIDGDEHDWRYGDYHKYPHERIIVGVRAKGKGKHDMSGFVVRA